MRRISGWTIVGHDSDQALLQLVAIQMAELFFRPVVIDRFLEPGGEGCHLIR